MKTMKQVFLNGTLLIIVGFLLFTGSCKKDDDTTSDTTPAPSTVTDIDGNVYHFVTIGTQVWMVENLKVKKYRNGDQISNPTDDTQWAGSTTGAYSNYDNSTTNADTYGRLYNWQAVNDSRKICPTGWHIPTDAEWATLTSYLGGESAAGGKMKETGTAHWLSPNTGATNEKGFTALPAGMRNSSGSFSNMFNHGYWWSSTESDATNAWSLNVNYNHANDYRNYEGKNTGFSVRCVKD
ncbi:MAG: hypothetical protein A2275_08655 [Bacteroidetes bacterium RIFOXYA12_FULL_35_11]|nr:MAG: hypothetical protein A2X01_16035 [Bacteroidetes bacterium GWF2_35_48]OFY72965.1 MAG: hypothetical protein A2275_08655 [Bacteroidetes bacterium RIFOXYA12_FULL_35_11]OFY93975.1 MAG: hypothetical protein A2491_10400 [Bacteroidetes bacterium RIFOXYC12_FULL_35_7]OFY94401.1 MAG: hypothetical protein A2309_03960 [Bacteroidetes bacterium RIFOXYB2_FULL_35_7]